MLQLYCGISAILTTWLKAALRVVMLLVLLIRSSIRGYFMCVCVCFFWGGGVGERWVTLQVLIDTPHPGPNFFTSSWLCVSSEISFTTHKTILIFLLACRKIPYRDWLQKRFWWVKINYLKYAHIEFVSYFPSCCYYDSFAYQICFCFLWTAGSSFHCIKWWW